MGEPGGRGGWSRAPENQMAPACCDVLGNANGPEDERQRERMARGACYMLAQVRVQRAVNFKERNRPSPSGMYAERLGLHLEWDMYDKEYPTQERRDRLYM